MPGWSIAVLGFFVGGLIGLTGVGGGVLMTPLLIVVFGVQPSVAVGTDLFYAALTKVVGALRHRRQGTANLRIAMLLSAGSLPSALVGSVGAGLVKNKYGPAVETTITAVLAYICLAVAAIMLIRVVLDWRGKQLGMGGLALTERQQQVLTVLLGVVTGLLVSITSIGAGSIVMVMLVSLYRLPARDLVGTDLAHAALLASTAALGHLWAGNVDFSLALLLLAGSIPGVLIGSRVSLHLPEAGLRTSLALILVYSGTRLIFK